MLSVRFWLISARRQRQQATQVANRYWQQTAKGGRFKEAAP